jgi:glycosyltransferase involved in cell wall biosynthesis
MPSAAEAFGIVYLEAWAVGKPVIGACTRAVSSLVDDGLDGYLIPPGDVGALAERIVYLLENPSQAQQMGQCGRRKVINRYTVPRIADRIEGIYLRVMRRYRRQTTPSKLNYEKDKP